MKGGLIYSNAIIAMREDKLLNKEKINRMIDSSNLTDAIKILYECGYNENIIAANPDNLDLLLTDEINKTISIFKEFCTDENLLNLVLLRYDYHNIKTIYKSKATGINSDNLLFKFGVKSADYYKKCVEEKNYKNLSEELKSALMFLDEKFEKGNLEPHDIDYALDKANNKENLKYISKIPSGQIEKYYRCEIDIKNILSFARIRLLGFNSDFAKEIFLQGGYIQIESLIPVLSEEVDKLYDLFKDTEYNLIMKKLCDGLLVKNINSAEVYMENYLVNISEKDKLNVFKLDPLFNWFIKKMKEFKTIKMIIISKKLNVPAEMLKHRMTVLEN